MPLNKEALAKSARRKDIFEFKEGENLLRVLPPDMKFFTEDIGYIAFKYLAHWGLGAEGSPPVVCPRTQDNTARCPICEKIRALKNTPSYKEWVDSVYPSRRFVFNVIDVNHPEKGIQVMETGPRIYDGIFKFAVDAEYGEVLDIDKGRNFKITLTPGSKHKTGYNQYDVLASANPSSIKELLPEDWKQKIEALAGTIGEIMAVEKIEELLAGGTAEAAAPAAPENATVIPAKTDAPPPPKAEAAAPPKQETPPATGEKKPCFGEGYSPSAEKCKTCPEKQACVTEFVRT